MFETDAALTLGTLSFNYKTDIGNGAQLQRWDHEAHRCRTTRNADTEAFEPIYLAGSYPIMNIMNPVQICLCNISWTYQAT